MRLKGRKSLALLASQPASCSTVPVGAILTENQTAWITILREVADPRVERTKLHKLEDILVIAICALAKRRASLKRCESGTAKAAWSAVSDDVQTR